MRFTRDDVDRFAVWSGDRNPLHVDATFARLTHFGQPVVHGILTVLSALEEARLKPSTTHDVRGLELEFRKAVFPGEQYSLDQTETPDGFTVTLQIDGEAVLTIRARTADVASGRSAADFSWTNTDTHPTLNPMRQAPVARTIEELQRGVELTGDYHVDPSARPWAPDAISPAHAQVLALCSYITGMELPGLRSLFTRVSVEFHAVGDTNGPLRYRARTRKCDGQFRLLETELLVADSEGSPLATATLRGYVPFSPLRTDLDQLQLRLAGSASRLQGKVALVVGASRGVGADIASTLALAGCEVYATARHIDDAAHNLQQTVTDRGGRIEFIEGDAGNREWCQATLATLRERHDRIDLLVLNACAPPSHARLGGHAASADYLAENLPLVERPLEAFVEQLQASAGAIVYLSSSFVTSSPAGFGRYVALKQAGEAMMRTVVHEYPSLSALIVRPPPLQTRWNDTPAGIAGAIPADWIASHLVNRLGDTWQAGQVEVLEEFAPFETRSPESSGAARSASTFEVRVAASFTTDPLLPGLSFWVKELQLDAAVQVAPYGQVLQSLLDPQSLFASRAKGLNVILLRLRDWLRELPDEQASDLDFVRSYLKDAATEFEQALRAHRARAGSDTLLVLCPSYGGASSAEHIVLRQTESELATTLAGVPGLTIVSAAAHHAAFAVNEDEIVDELRDEIAHIPYRDAYLHVLATLVVRQVQRRTAPLRKVVVVDCDNTLWRGVVGEVGPEGLEFDAGHRALHEALIRLSAAGVLVCLCSKNEEADVWHAFDTRSDLGLRREHVTAATINWLPKSQNLRALAAKLNLGIDSFVFIDDNPVECAEVRTNCPEVLTLQWPQQDDRAIALLREAWELEATAGTKEDQRRAQMYRDELERQSSRTSSVTFEDFIKSLQLAVDVEGLTDDTLRRAAQLTLRTNQFNFTTKRRSESELQALVAGGGHDVRTVRVRDRFGDYGLVGLVIVERGRDTWDVDTFLLSCRVLGRGVEHQILSDVGKMAVAAGARSVRVRLDTTPRNTPARMFLESVVAQEFRTADATGIEAVIPAAVLGAARFEPTADAETTVQEEGDSTAGRASVDFGSIRRREEQLARASAALFTMDGLQAAIEGRSHASTANASSTGDVETVVYQAFATALRMPVDAIRSVDRLEALGCDSLRIVEITVALREPFPWLPSTLLFEHRAVSGILDEIRTLAGAAGSKKSDARLSPAVTTSSKATAGSTDVAVVGMHVTTAGAQSPDELWELLKNGRSAVRSVPANRQHFIGGLHDVRPHWAGLIESPARFDPEFFGVSPREAEYMDPQLRLFLQVAWSAIEDAGYAGADHEPDTGVFVGVMYGDYGLRANRGESESPYRCWEGFSLANRLSQLLDFHGPSLAVDTACSSSGTALHLACRALRDGECRVAIAGGVNLILDPDRFASLARLGILSASGACEPFGANADGTVLGEGAGVVILRPLDEALRRGDRIYGVIKGTGLSTGNGTVGFTAPNPQAQAEAIRRGIEAAGIDPRTVTYVETHGTGTALGDPIEVRGLTLGYGNPSLLDPSLDIKHRCTLGSIKPNIGHLEAGAGVVGLIKVLLQLHHRTLVPSITSDSPNPQIPFEQTPFAVQRTAEPWEPLTLESEGRRVSVPRRAGLSSFGVGGANAHVILEEAPPSHSAAPKAPGERSAHLVAVSARSDESLRKRLASARQFLDSRPAVSIADFAHSLNAGHQHFAHRVAIVAKTREELIAKLEASSTGEDSRGVTRGALSPTSPAPKVAFLFTGQGSQQPGMGRELYETQPVFKDALDRCASIFDSLLGRSLLELLFAGKGTPEAELLNQTGFTQPALFAFEYALASLWQSWGIQPAVVLGHSVGEIGAMCVAGGVSLEDGLKLIAARGRLMQALPPGGTMTSVMADENLVLGAIAGREEIAIAAVNAPRQVVISGAGTAVAEVTARLTADGIKTKALTVSHAFHSPLMRPMLAEYERVVRTIRFVEPRIPFVSCVDGALVTHEVTRPDYWLRQVMDPVRFAAGMRALEAQGATAYVEIGPQPVLLGMGRQCLDDSSTEVSWLPSLKPDTDSWQTMLGSLSVLYAKGAPVDWKGFDAPYSRQRVTVPAYAFREKDYWLRGLDSANDMKQLSRTIDSSTASVQPGRSGPQIYQLRWEKRPVPSPVHQPKDTTWIVFADRQSVGARLARVLSEQGAVPTLVTDGGRFEQIAEHEYRIDAASADDYSRIWSRITTASQNDIRLVYLWGLDTPVLDGARPSDAAGDFPATEALLHLSRVVSNGGRTKPTLWCVTRNAVGIDVASSGSLAIEQSPLWGFGRTAALEHPAVWGGLIDLGSDASTAELRALVDEVVAAGPEDQVALRGTERYVARLERGEIPNVAPLVLASNASYLVTGGGGALGAHVARWLIARGARHLVLASRRGGADPQARSVAQDLEALGAQVTVVAADISRAESVDTLVTAISKSGHALRGVVHAAGIDVPTPIRELSVEGLRAVLAPKVTGGWLLHERTQSLPLDFFVCFSSVASVLGSNGRAHYGAANAFLDSLAQKRRQLGLPALSVNWGPWRGGGMATDQHLREYERIGNRGLDPSAALTTLERLVASTDPHATVVDIDWDVFKPVYESRRTRPMLAGLENENVRSSEPVQATKTTSQTEEAASGQWVTTLRALPVSERAPKLEALLREEIADTLGFDDSTSVEPAANFYDIGMDSLMMAELVGRLKKRIGIPSSALVFDHPTAQSLTAALLDRLDLNAAPAAAPAPPAPGTPHSGTVGYQPELESEIFAFQAHAWPHRSVNLIPARWRWMVVESARRLGRSPIAWLYRDEGTIVGHMGAIAVNVQLGSEVRESAWCIDTMVLESHRNRAVGSRLMLDARETLPFALSLGQTSEMRQICLRLGWKQVASLQVAQLLVRPENVLKGKLPAPAAWAAGMGLRASAAARQFGRRPANLTSREVPRFDERHDRVWQEASRDLTCAVVRDASYLNWKYVDQPGQEFVRLELLEGERVRAVAIWMFREPDKNYKYRRAFLVDLVVPLADSSLVAQALRAAIAVPEERGADALLCMHTDPRLTSALRDCGFTLRDPERFLLVDPGPLTGGALEHALASDSWYVTQGDSDIDRPW